MIPTKKLKNGFELPVYGLGLWQIGGRDQADYSQDRCHIETIQKALEEGITHLDTAESYGAGHAEELLGQAIQGYARQNLKIVSKVAAENQYYSGVLAACERSLKRLKTDYLDLYLLHHPGAAKDLPGTMRALDELVSGGRVKHIGVCNLSPRFLRWLEAESACPIVCNQVHYNVQIREVEHAKVLQDCEEHDRLLVAWRPLQKGALVNNPLLDEIAQKYGKTPAQVALNWLITQKNVVTVAKTSHHEHLIENLGALSWSLDKEDHQRIQQEFPGQQALSDAVPLYR